MWALLIPLLSQLFGTSGVVGQYLQTKAAAAQSAADYQLKVLDDKMQLSAIQAKAEVDSAANKIAMTTPTVKAWILAILNLPIIINCISPAHGQLIFATLQTVPQWYAMFDVAIVGTIFGLPIAANWMASVFGSIQDFWSARQDKKIEKIQAVGEMNQVTRDAARKEILDTMRHAVNLNGYTAAQFAAIKPVLDKYFPEDNTNSDTNVTVNTGDPQ